MKRAGFTMIELIFVIVILGILSAVAVPKMMGVSEKAKVGTCKSFYASLNRSVGPTLWSNMAINGTNADTAFAEEEILKQIDIPTNPNCGTIGVISDAATDGTSFTIKLDDVDYDINATKATSAAAPSWSFGKK